jgi:2-dehydropantoate 2-reductase
MLAGARRQRSRIGILGAGAQGMLFGWHLAAIGEVTFLDVRGEPCARLEREGVRVAGREPRRVRATLEPSALFACDVICVFVKAYDTLRALRPFAGRLDPSTTIVSLQNGFGNEEAIKAALGGVVALVVGVTTETAVSLGDGAVQRIGEGRTVIGSAGAAAATVEQTAGLISAAGLDTRVAYDIRPHLWGKLIANAAINPVSALLDCSTDAILDDADAAALARAVALEAAAVGQALRIQLPFTDPWAYVREIARQTAGVRSTMALDLAAGKRTEVEQINGAIVTCGRRALMPAPYNESMLRLIKARERQHVRSTVRLTAQP